MIHLQPQQSLVLEDSALRTIIVEILRRPSRPAIGLREITRELQDRYDPIEIELCILSLSQEGLAELVYTSGYDVGLRARP